MSLVTCNECSGKVSTTASACPHCGAPVSHAVFAGLPTSSATGSDGRPHNSALSPQTGPSALWEILVLGLIRLISAVVLGLIAVLVFLFIITSITDSLGKVTVRSPLFLGSWIVCTLVAWAVLINRGSRSRGLKETLFKDRTPKVVSKWGWVVIPLVVVTVKYIQSCQAREKQEQFNGKLRIHESPWNPPR